MTPSLLIELLITILLWGIKATISKVRNSPVVKADHKPRIHEAERSSTTPSKSHTQEKHMHYPKSWCASSKMNPWHFDLMSVFFPFWCPSWLFFFSINRIIYMSFSVTGKNNICFLQKSWSFGYIKVVVVRYQVLCIFLI